MMDFFIWIFKLFTKKELFKYSVLAKGKKVYETNDVVDAEKFIQSYFDLTLKNNLKGHKINNKTWNGYYRSYFKIVKNF